MFGSSWPAFALFRGAFGHPCEKKKHGTYQHILITYINSVAAECKCSSNITPKLVTGHDPGTVPPTFTYHSLLCRYFPISSSSIWKLPKKFPHQNSVCPHLSNILATFSAHRSILDFTILAVPGVTTVWIRKVLQCHSFSNLLQNMPLGRSK